MNLVGKKFETGEYFVADLIYAGELMTAAVGILKSALIQGKTGGKREMIILCTVRGDLHDIGKNIVKSMLEAGGFDVIDLGIDVAPEKIVEEAKKGGAKIVGLSGVLTLAIDSMKQTVEPAAHRH
jgi:methanogenic corrinoid protein MtbC1